MDVPCRMSRWDRHVAESMEMETSFKDVAVSLAPFAASQKPDACAKVWRRGPRPQQYCKPSRVRVTPHPALHQGLVGKGVKHT